LPVPGDTRRWRSPRRRKKQSSVDRALASPARNLVGGSLFVLVVSFIAILAYLRAGWSFGDALYMAVITVFTVGYDEVRPIDTPELRTITIALICLGCTGMIFVTGALIQFISAVQFSELLDTRRMNNRIEALRDHIIVCGYGRIGMQLAIEFDAAGMGFVIIERSEARCAEARAQGYLAIRAEATEEEALRRAGVERARALATVLPDDAANVFITLSARSLNRDLAIIARGESPATERMLTHAGANRVVLPAYIGAERMAELILFPAMADAASGPRTSEADLRRLGLALEVIVAAKGSDWVGLTVRDIEQRADSAFLIVELERAGTARRERPNEDTRVAAGDGVVVVGRTLRAALEGFGAKR
jgi:voltage-gated potassium channel Kch